MKRLDEWAGGGRAYLVTVFSDVLTRDGLGWELDDVAPAPGRGTAFEVFREDSGAQPVLTAHAFEPVSHDLALKFTTEATADLLGITDDTVGWIAKNIGRALAMAGRQVRNWQAVEWPIGLDDVDPSASEFAPADAARVPFSWLRAELTDGDEADISTYQDDGVFGLCFTTMRRPRLQDYEQPGYRVHSEASLPTGIVESVTVTVDADARAAGALGDHLPIEAVLTISGQPMMLLAAEPDEDGEWRRYDECVVVLRDPADADRLPWTPPRIATRSAEA